MKEKFVIKSVITLIVYGFQFLSFYYMALRLDVNSMGIYALSSSLAGFFTMFLDLGINAIHFRNSSSTNFKNYFGSYFTIKFSLLILNFSIPIIFLFNNHYDAQILNIFIIMLISTFFLSFSNIFQMNLEVKLKIFKIQIVDFFLNIFKTGFIFYILFNLARFTNPLLSIVIVNMIFQALRLIIFVIININENIFSKPDFQLILNYIKDTKNLALLSVFLIVNNYIGLILLGESYGSEELAYYFVIQNYIINSLILITGSTDPLFFSIFPKYFDKHDFKSIEKISHMFERFGGILFTCLIFIVLMCADELFDIFLPKYSSAVIYLKFLIIIPFLNTINRPYGGMLTLGKRTDLTAKVSIFLNISKLILIIILVPKEIFGIKFFGLGAWGLIIATYYYNFVQNILIKILIKKKFNINTYILHIVKILIIGLFSFLFSNLIILIIENFFVLSEILIVIVSLILLIIVYIFGLYLFKELNKEDINYLLSLLKMSNYVKSYKEEIN